MEAYINSVIKPKIQADGGEIDFVSFENGVLTVLFQGECSKCLITDRCTAWIENEAERDLGERITVKAYKKRPFFWDIAEQTAL